MDAIKRYFFPGKEQKDVDVEVARADGGYLLKLPSGADPNRVLSFCTVALGVRCRSYPGGTTGIEIPLRASASDERVDNVLSKIMERAAALPVEMALSDQAVLAPVPAPA